MVIQVPPTLAYAALKSRRRKLVGKVGGVILWHGTMLIVCAFVLIPIVLVVLGSFKTVAE